MVEQNETWMTTGRSAQSSCFMTVDIPPCHEGVGKALRKAYRGDDAALPADMLTLLDQLEHH